MRHGAKLSVVLAGSFSLGLAGVACVQSPIFAPPAMPRFGGNETSLPPSTAPAPAEPIAAPIDPTIPLTTTAAAARPMATARLGSISETLALTGRVSSADESAIRIQAAGRIEKVHVALGQTVEPGQLLLELDTRDQAKELATLRGRLDTASLRLAQANQIAEQRVRDAEAEARRAQSELAVTRAGAPASERQMAEAAVEAARSSFDRAQADLVRVRSGPTAAELREAEQLVVIARTALQRAEADLAKVNRGADPVDLSNTDREALTAQAALERAQSDLDRLQRGPDPADVASAQRDIERAEINLRAARTTVASGAARAQRDAAILTAEAGLREAQARFERLLQGPRADDVATARRNVEIASANLALAQQRQALVRRGPDTSVVSAASLAVDQARLAADVAETKYQALHGGATQAQISTAATAVDSARANYVAAQARLADINRRGTGAEAMRAEDRVSVAAAAVEKARQAATVDQDQKNPAALDVILIQKEVLELKAQVDTLERQVADGSPKAPFTGQVSAITVRPGDPIEPGQVVVSIAKPTLPLVIVDLTDDVRERLSEGQTASVRIDNSEPTQARLQSIAVSGTGNRVARLVTEAPLPRGGVGTAAQVNVVLSHKDNVLLLPRKAIKSAGARRYVEQMEGTSRRLVDVQVGLTSGDDIEIVTGLLPGESVLVPA